MVALPSSFRHATSRMERGDPVPPGNLERLWKLYPGGQQQLAHDAGLSRGTLTRINRGSMTREAGMKIISAKGWPEPGIGLVDLGVPAEEADDQASQTALVLLKALSAEVKRLGADLAVAQQHLATLEAQRDQHGSQPRARKRKASS